MYCVYEQCTIVTNYVTRSNCLEVMRLFRLESHRAQLGVVMGNVMDAE